MPQSPTPARLAAQQAQHWQALRHRLIALKRDIDAASRDAAGLMADTPFIETLRLYAFLDGASASLSSAVWSLPGAADPDQAARALLDLHELQEADAADLPIVDDPCELDACDYGQLPPSVDLDAVTTIRAAIADEGRSLDFTI